MRAAPLLLLAALSACGQPSEGASPCAAAAEHLAACVGDGPAPALDDCDPAEADAILELDCDGVRGVFADPKADWARGLAAFACRAGYYAACSVPACVDAPEIEPPAPEDPCAEWLRYEGCAVCEYYRCREARAPCGPDGYLLGYVGVYCDRYARVTEPRVSPAAAAWLQRIRRCLIEYLEAEVPYDASCAEVDRRGTDSHAVCYVETGFCDLSVADWFGVLNTIDPGDAPLRVLLATAHGCLGEWLGR